MRIREEGETGTISNSESSHDIWPFFPAPKIVSVCGIGPKKEVEHKRSDNQAGWKETAVFSRLIQMFVPENWLDGEQPLDANDEDQVQSQSAESFCRLHFCCHQNTSGQTPRVIV